MDPGGHLDHDGVEVAEIVELPPIKSFTSDLVSFAIDTNGRLWSWGDNKSKEPYLSKPELVDFLAEYRIKQVAEIAYESVYCLTTEGQVLKLIKGQAPERVEIGQKVTQLSCGAEHALLLGADGKNVWTFGCNRGGQLGHNYRSVNKSYTPIKVPFLGKQKLIKLQCGDYCSAALTGDGEIILWGSMADLSDSEVRLDSESGHIPRVIKIEEKFVEISMLSDFMLALTDNNRLFALGNNEYGQCGQGETDQNFFEEPVEVKNLHNLHIRQISAGRYHCLIKCTKK